MVPIICPQCQKRFRWTPAVAGRIVRCTCGCAIQCPAEAPADPTAYALAPDAAPAPRRRPVAAVAARVVAETPAAAPVRLAYRTPKDESPTDPETIKNLYMPLWLLGGGVVINVVAVLLHREQHSLTAALIAVGVQMLFGTAFMTVGLLLAARPRGIKLGPLPVAVFKLAAISVAPTALVALFSPFLEHVPLGGVLGWVAEFVFYFALLGVFFDLDESDTWYCVFVIFIVQVAVYFLLMWAMAKWA
jgi:hypothetical protein